MIAKHVGLYDKQSGENPEILKEKELPQTHKKALTDREEIAMAIFLLLPPYDRESTRKAMDRKKAQMEEDEDIDFDCLDFMTGLWEKENLKKALGGTIDRIYDRWQ